MLLLLTEMQLLLSLSLSLLSLVRSLLLLLLVVRRGRRVVRWSEGMSVGAGCCLSCLLLSRVGLMMSELLVVGRCVLVRSRCPRRGVNDESSVGSFRIDWLLLRLRSVLLLLLLHRVRLLMG